MRTLSITLTRQKWFDLLLFILVCGYAITSCQTRSCSEAANVAAYEYQIPPQTDDGWETASLSDVRMNQTLIADMMNLLRSRNDHSIHGIVIVRSDKLVFEEYFPGNDLDIVGRLALVYRNFDRNTLHYQASATKSFTSALLGIAIDKGLVADVNQPILPFFPEQSRYSDSMKERILIAHCLAMCSGFPWDESSYPYDDSRNNMTAFLFSSDPFGYLLSRSLYTSPGTQFLYNSGDTNILGEIVRRTSGERLTDFADQYLFRPLRIRTYTWVRLQYAPEVTFASGGLYLLPRDMAKLGQLYLREGVWKGSRIVSAEWVRASVKESISLPASIMQSFHANGYGYQWWLETFRGGSLKAYSARGWGNQYIVVLPGMDMVVVFTGGAYYQSVRDARLQYYSLIENYILPSLP